MRFPSPHLSSPIVTNPQPHAASLHLPRLLNHLNSNLFSPSMASSSMDPGRKATDQLFHAALTGNLALFERIAYRMGRRFPEAMQREGDSDGITVLHYATICGSTQLIRFLVEEGNLDVNVKDYEAGETPLHYAIMGEKFLAALYFLERGANPNSITKRGHNSLHFAVKYGPKQLIEILISMGADINAMSTDIGTPLQYAAGLGKTEYVEVLLAHKADPNLISHDLFCPLLASIMGGSFDCSNLLLKAGADPNICGSRGRTPLGWAAALGETEAIKCLLLSGADPNIPNDCGMTPLEEVAVKGEEGHEDFLILFPVTYPVPGVLEWSLLGLFQHVHSTEAEEMRNQNATLRVMLAKSKAARAFELMDYFGATHWYSEAIYLDPTNVDILSNRSLCLLHMNEPALALADAENCIDLRPDWPEAYFRAGSAWMRMKNYERAANAFFRGWNLDRKNQEMECSFRMAINAQKDEVDFNALGNHFDSE